MEHNNQELAAGSLAWFIRMVLVIGAILLGIGGMLFVYSHWATFPRMIKVGIFALPSLLSLVVGAWLISHKQNVVKTGHALCFLAALLWVVAVCWAGMLYSSLNNFKTMLLLAQVGVLVSLLVDPLILTGIVSAILAFLWSYAVDTTIVQGLAFMSVAVFWFSAGSLWLDSTRFRPLGKFFRFIGGAGGLFCLIALMFMFGNPFVSSVNMTVYAAASAAALFVVGRLLVKAAYTKYDVILSGIMLMALVTAGNFVPQPTFFAGILLLSIAFLALFHGFESKQRGSLWMGVFGITALVHFFMESAHFHLIATDVFVFSLLYLDGIHTNWYIAALLLLGVLWLTIGNTIRMKSLDPLSARWLKYGGVGMLLFACWRGLFHWHSIMSFARPFPGLPMVAYELRLFVWCALMVLFALFEWYEQSSSTTLQWITRGTLLFVFGLLLSPVLFWYPLLYLVFLLVSGLSILLVGVRKGRTVLVYGGAFALTSPLFAFVLPLFGFVSVYSSGVPFFLFMIGLLLLLFSFHTRGAAWAEPLFVIGMGISTFCAYLFSFPAVCQTWAETPVRSWVELGYFVFCIGAFLYLSYQMLRFKKWSQKLLGATMVGSLLSVAYTFFYEHFPLSFLEAPFFATPVLNVFALSLFFNSLVMLLGLGIVFWGVQRARLWAVSGGALLVAVLLTTQLLGHLDAVSVRAWINLYGLAFAIVMSRMLLFAPPSVSYEKSYGLGILGEFVCLYVVTFNRPLQLCAQGIGGVSPYIDLPHILARSILIPLGLAAIAVLLLRTKSPWAWAEQLLSGLLLLFCFSPATFNSLWFTNGCFVVASCILIGQGIEREKLVFMGTGLCALLVLFITRFTDHFWSTISRSLFFMACGAVLLCLGAFFEWQRWMIERRKV